MEPNKEVSQAASALVTELLVALKITRDDNENARIGGVIEGQLKRFAQAILNQAHSTSKTELDTAFRTHNAYH